MNLSDNFTLEEMVFSKTARDNNIDNTPDDGVINNLKSLCLNLLEPLRFRLGKPIHILSGYRCRELNETVGGVGNSKHLYGQAADITVEGMGHPELFAFIKNTFQFDQLILEHVKEENSFSGWVHVSFCKDKNRNQCLKIGN
jgi:zinc D-Ala-D-Ala carboxypeptidase